MEIDLDVETDEEMEELLETPRKHKMRKTITRLRLVASRRLACIKRLRSKNKRLMGRVKKLTDLVTDLKKKRYISEEEEMQLNIDEKMSCLMQAFQNSFKKKKTFKKFPNQLKKFALTLNFYSPAAYRYIRSSLNNALPHPNTLLNWYDKINGDPGFTKESFRTLQTKSEESKSPIICNLVLDEMAIRQQKIFDGKKHVGFVNHGAGDTEEDKLASSALVLMVVSLNEPWKLPIGHFFTHGLTGARLANIVTMALKKCAQNNVEIVSVTCDGCQTNIAAMRIMGCKINDALNLKTTFPHPTTGKDVALFLDACHMLKLVRNNFESKGTFIDKDNKIVSWQHVKSLQETQEKEGVRAANKLTTRHINFRQQIMKVKLATQLLSNSVAKGLEILRQTSKEIIDNQATQVFVKLNNDVFDVLNSKGDPNSYGFKKALRPKNKEKVFKLIDDYKEYMTKLKVKITKKVGKEKKSQSTVTEMKDVLNSKIKTGFLGLLICLESLKVLYKSLIESNKINYLATYRLSQDHLELLFGCIRQRGGFNNNPNVIQFKSAYKKLLIHLELKSGFTGNCVPLEKINIISCMPENPTQEINESCSGHRNDSFSSDESETKSDADDTWIRYQHFDLEESLLTEFSKQTVGYISGYIATSTIKELKCNVCITALMANEYLWFHKLIVMRDNGGLFYPSREVFEICLSCEAIIRESITISGSGSLSPKYTPAFLKTRTLEKLQIKSEQLKGFALHPVEDHSYCLEVDHPLLLVNAIINKYVKVRLHHEAKMFNINFKKDYKRQLFNKLTLNSGV